MFTGARGQQRTVVEVERIDAADLNAGHVVVTVARQVAVSAARTDVAARSAEGRVRVG